MKEVKYNSDLNNDIDVLNTKTMQKMSYLRFWY